VLALTDHLCARAGQAGLEVFSSRAPEDKSGIVSLLVPGDVRQLVKRCRAEGLVINQRAGRIRVSPHCYNSMAEIDRLMETLAH
jgi:selenocysteine lyase/cysteine desulfurase